MKILSAEQFGVLLTIFQDHLRNVHHIEVVLIGGPSLAVLVWIGWQLKRIADAVSVK